VQPAATNAAISAATIGRRKATVKRGDGRDKMSTSCGCLVKPESPCGCLGAR
jgi:hypothetical protein